jgi:hypothetical protein
MNDTERFTAALRDLRLQAAESCAAEGSALDPAEWDIAIEAACSALAARPHALDDRELATVLAGLRCYQRAPWDADLADIATISNTITELTVEDIDALCERLNITVAASAPTRPGIITKAIGHLRSARDMLRTCGSQRAADYVARAIKSAEGAHRHASRGDIIAKGAAR